MGERKTLECVGKGALIAYIGLALYGLAYMVLRDTTDIRIIPDKWFGNFSTQGHTYRDTSAIPIDNISISPPDSLENTVLPSSAKPDGTRNII